jgi:putative chitinase
MISKENFIPVISDVSWIYAAPYVPLFDSVLPRFGINTQLRKAHFLAQIAHESAGFKATTENLNYSDTALYNVFRKYFPTLESAKAYARQPERIANKVYANRMGNGDEASGDGWKYRGRGLIQLTGKANYEAFSQAVGQDFVSNPDLVATPEWALSSACWYWKNRNINRFADTDDIHMVTKSVNGGFNGLDHRQHFLEEFKSLYNV